MEENSDTGTVGFLYSLFLSNSHPYTESAWMFESGLKVPFTSKVKTRFAVILAHAGIQQPLQSLDSRLRGNDEYEVQLKGLD